MDRWLVLGGTKISGVQGATAAVGTCRHYVSNASFRNTATHHLVGHATELHKAGGNIHQLLNRHRLFILTGSDSSRENHLDLEAHNQELAAWPSNLRERF